MNGTLNKIGNTLKKHAALFSTAALALALGGFYFLQPQQAAANEVGTIVRIAEPVTAEEVAAEDKCASLKAEADAASGWNQIGPMVKALQCKVFGPNDEQQAAEDQPATITPETTEDVTTADTKSAS